MVVVDLLIGLMLLVTLCCYLRLVTVVDLLLIVRTVVPLYVGGYFVACVVL